MPVQFREPYLKNNNGSIIIYYTHKSTAKIPTGVTISSKDKSGRFVEWDEKNRTLKASAADSASKRDILRNQLNKAISILNNFASRDIVLTGFELKEEFQRDKVAADQTMPEEKTILELLDEFVLHKKKVFEVKGSMSSLKDYKSLHFALSDYQTLKNKTLKLQDFNEDWLLEFHTWLRSDIALESKKKNIKTTVQGLMKNSTVKKRFDTLYSFFKYLRSKKIYEGSLDFISDYKRDNRYLAVNFRQIKSRKLLILAHEKVKV